MDNSHTYVARKACGCVRGCAVDTPEHAYDVATSVFEWIRAGCTVERMVTEEVRVMDWRCHEHEKLHQRALAGAKTLAGHDDD